MANKKITDLPAATTVNDSDAIEKVTLPGSTNASEQATLLQLKNYAVAPELSFKDGYAVEIFEDYAAGAISSFDKGYGWAANGVGSGCSIVARTAYGNQAQQQKRLSITSGQYGRKFAFGDSWGRVILCALWRVNSVAATFGPLGFYFGVCSGTTNMAGSALTDNFVGLRGPNNSAADATLTAGTRMSYYDINPPIRFASKRAAVTTDRGGGAGSTGRMVASTEGFLSVFLLDITRPTFANDAASVSYAFAFNRTGAPQSEFSLAKNVMLDFLSEPQTTTLASGAGLTVITGFAPTVATPYNFDQSTGDLDTFNFTWDQALGVELACIGARKVY